MTGDTIVATTLTANTTLTLTTPEAGTLTDGISTANFTEIERYARAGIKSVMTFGVSHHLDASGSDTWKERGLVSRMSSTVSPGRPSMK